jgi:putative phosphoesterase
MTMNIGVVSDTHIREGKGLPAGIFSALTGVDHILHAGDILWDGVLIELSAVAPTTAVAGNVDPWILHHSLGKRRIANLGGVRIGLVHGDGGYGTTLARAKAAFEPGSIDCLCFGHSHQPLIMTEPDLLIVNPGSAVQPRMSPKPSIALLHIDDGRIDGEIVELS